MSVTQSVIPNAIRQRIVGAIFVTQVLFRAAVILSFTLTSIIAAELMGNDLAAGLPTTISLATRALLAYPVGWLLDRWGRRIGLSLGFMVGVIGALISAWSIINGSFAGFLFGAALYGGTQASSEQGRYVAAEIFPRNQQSKIIGWVIFAGTIGALLGPILVSQSTQLAESQGMVAFAGPFLVTALIFLIASVIIFIFLRPDPQKLGIEVAAAEDAALATRPASTAKPAENDDIQSGESSARSLRKIFAHPLALLAVAAMAIGQLVMTMLMVITPLHMNHQGSGTGEISFVILAHTLGMFGLSGVTGWLIGRVGRLTMVSAGAIVLISSAVMAPNVNGVFLLAVALFLLGLGWNFAFVAGSSLLSDQLKPAERGRAQGAGEMSVAIGSGMGSLGSGFIFAWGGILAVSIVGLGFSFALLGLVFWYRLSTRTREVLPAGQD
jgi:MFS family permease